MNSFLSTAELSRLGFKSLGKNLQISRHANFYFHKNICLGNNVRIDDFCILSAKGSITIGNNIHISAYACIYGGGGVVMKDHSGMSARSTILSESDNFSGDSPVGHSIPHELKFDFQSALTIIGRYSQIGLGSSVLPGANIGEGSAIAAYSLVTKPCGEWTIYGGVPAKPIKTRSRKLVKILNEIED